MAMALLALATLVAEHSRNVKAGDKFLLGKFLNGQTYASKKKIAVAADAVTCKTSDVDITLHSWSDLWSEKDHDTRQKAHELYATLAEVGVPPDGTAGSIFEAVSNLDCTIEPDEVKQKAGGGAHCTFVPAKWRYFPGLAAVTDSTSNEDIFEAALGQSMWE
jgi:hypothetical protein